MIARYAVPLTFKTNARLGAIQIIVDAGEVTWRHNADIVMSEIKAEAAEIAERYVEETFYEEAFDIEFGEITKFETPSVWVCNTTSIPAVPKPQAESSKVDAPRGFVLTCACGQATTFYNVVGRQRLPKCRCGVQRMVTVDRNGTITAWLGPDCADTPDDKSTIAVNHTVPLPHEYDDDDAVEDYVPDGLP